MPRSLPFMRYLLDSTATHQRNTPTKSSTGGEVPAWANVTTGLRCAVWPTDTAGDVAEAFARRDIVTTHILCFDADLSALAKDRFTVDGRTFVVEGVMNYGNTSVLPRPVYLVAANERRV